MIFYFLVIKYNYGSIWADSETANLEENWHVNQAYGLMDSLTILASQFQLFQFYRMINKMEKAFKYRISNGVFLKDQTLKMVGSFWFSFQGRLSQSWDYLGYLSVRQVEFNPLFNIKINPFLNLMFKKAFIFNYKWKKGT